MKRLTGKYKNGTAYYNIIPGENTIDRLAAIEDILGDEYDLDRLRELVGVTKDIPHRCNYCIGCEIEPKDGHGCDGEYDNFVFSLRRLRELVEADKEGRCVMLPIKIPGWGWYCNNKFPNAISAYFDRPSQVVDCMEDYILRGTKEQAEEALKAREQDG